MNKYVATLKLGLMDAVEYRTEFFVSIFGWGVRLFIAVFLWLAVTRARGGQIGDYDFNRIMNYFFIVQILSGLVFSRVGFDISRDIYRGDFAHYMLKPINYLSFRLLNEVTKNIIRTLINIVIFGAFIVFVFGGFTLPLWKFPAILIAVIGSYLINFCLVSLIAGSAFWIINATRLTFIYFGILTIFSGMLIPLDLFPRSIAVFFEKLPLPYIFYFPAKIVQADTFDPAFWMSFLIQWGYVVVLGLLLVWLFKKGERRFESVGH